MFFKTKAEERLLESNKKLSSKVDELEKELDGLFIERRKLKDDWLKDI